MEEETSFEVGLGEHWARAHASFKFEKGSVLGGPPVPSDGFPGEVKEWTGDFGVVWDEVAIVACEAKELTDFGWISWGLPLSYAIEFGWVHTHVVLSDDHS